jgi:flagellin
MSTRIQGNSVSRMAANALQANHKSLGRSANRISSGSRVANIGTDASGSAVAVNLSTRANSIRQAARNANDGLTILATNEGAAKTTGDLLVRMRELAIQSSSETLSDTERAYASDEFSSKADEIKRLVFVTQFNGASIASGLSRDVQVGADNSSDHQISITGANIKAVHLEVRTTSIATASDALSALDDIDDAMDVLNSQRANLGAEMNRLESALSNATAEAEALTGAASRIFDTDYAEETAHMTALQIRSQAGMAALSQANNMSSSVISLIG